MGKGEQRGKGVERREETIEEAETDREYKGNMEQLYIHVDTHNNHTHMYIHVYTSFVLRCC